MKYILSIIAVLFFGFHPAFAQTQFASEQQCMETLDKVFLTVRKNKINLASAEGMELKLQAAETAGKCRSGDLAAATKSFGVLENMIVNWGGPKTAMSREGQNICQDKAAGLAKELKENNIPASVGKNLEGDIVRMEGHCKAGNSDKSDKMYKSIQGTITDMKGMGSN